MSEPYIYETPKSVTEGQEVLAPFATGMRIVCHVAVAAGYHAKVVNERRKFAKWFHIDDLRTRHLVH